jgi:thiamine pyrophosphate-dependent acetolactate synthase large subunit-like protein
MASGFAKHSGRLAVCVGTTGPGAILLGAPVAQALLGKAVPPDDSPFTTASMGALGTAPSSWAMKACDTVIWNPLWQRAAEI